MRILITGGLGFIGSALGKTLVAEGHDVRLTDILDHSATRGSEYLQADVLDSETCRATCEGMDVVVHSAAIHEAGKVAESPLTAVAINVEGTLNLLHAAVSAGAKRFVYLSSAKVFGNPEILPSAETDLPVPRETYALSKFMSEYYCRALQEKFDLDVAIVRPFSVYGPGQELDSGYIGMILSAVMNDSDLVLPGRPDFVRDFVYIDDVTRLCAQVCTAQLSGAIVLNAGSGTPTRLSDLVALASGVSGVNLDGRFRQPGPGTLERMQACMERARSLLGFTPMYDLGDGLKKTIDWFLENRHVSGEAARR